MLPRSDDPKWQYCPGSIEAEKDYIPKLNGHEITTKKVMGLLSSYFIDGVNVFTSIGENNCTTDGSIEYVVDKKILDKVQCVLDYYKTLYQKDNCKIRIVESIELNGCNYVNYISVISDDHIEVIIYSNEYKNIPLLDNPQLLLALIHEIDKLTIDGVENETIAMTVIQPNCINPVSTQPIDLGQLDSKVDPLLEKLRYLKPGSPRVENHLCKTCLAYSDCPQAKQQNKEVTMQHELIIAKVHDELETMSETDLSAILSVEETFIDAFTKANLEAESRIDRGEVIPGWHMSSGNKSSVWNEDKDVIVKKLKAMKIVKDEIFPSKLISPAKARKLEKLSDIQRNNLEKLISEVEGRPRLKPNDFQPIIQQEYRSFI